MKYLIIYASKYGTTEQAAKLLEQNIRANDTSEVHLVNIKNARADLLTEYEVIALGSCTYMGSIDKTMKRFVELNEAALMNKRLGIFMCASQPTEEGLINEMRSNFGEKLYEKATVKAFFGYAYNLEKMGFMDKTIIKKVAKITSSENHINEDEIKNFANKL